MKNKDGWEIDFLDEICEINYGTRVVNSQVTGGEYFVYGGGGATFTIDRYNREDCLVIARFAMSKQCVRIVRGKFFLNDSGLSLTIKNPEGLKDTFLNYQMFWLNDTIYNSSKGAAQKNLDVPYFRKLKLVIPPLPTQHQIVSELDTLSDIISKKKQQLEELDKLAQATFYDMFGDPVTNEKGWEKDLIGNVAPAKAYKGNVKSKEGKFWLLNLDMVESNTGKIISINMVEKHEIGNSTTSFNEDNVLYSKLRPYLNKVVNPESSGYATSELIPLLPNKHVLNKVFLTQLLRSDFFVNYIQEKVAGAKMPRVSMDIFRAFKVILPPLNLQNEFATKIESIESQKSLITQSIAEVQQLFDYTMDKYFE